MASEARSLVPDPPSDGPGAEGEEELVDIGEACRRCGVSARTIRYYEEVGLLPGVRRRASGRRVYGPDELERLAFIGRLKKLGLTLAEIRELNAVYAIAGSTHDMLQVLDAHLGRHLVDLDARIEELVSLRDDMTRYRDRIGARVQQLNDPAQAAGAASQSSKDNKEDRS
ncbi:MAG: MerR family transcriptional regulator [Myxococcota bacterium]|jgi:DNA-binding transcriptional MerR regulator|nr:MerR family transcriptional regulator [Myxococcota bacterium]